MKNATIFRLQPGADLHEALKSHAFQPCGPQDAVSAGWVSPAGHSDGLVHAIGLHYLITMQVESKVLPSSVILAKTNAMIAEIENERGMRPGRKERAVIKEQAIATLLQVAFSTYTRVTAWISPIDGWIVVDTSSLSKAEDLISLLRASDPSVKVSSFKTEAAPEDAMRGWLLGEPLAGFTIDDECELVRKDEGNPSVRYARHSLDGDDVKAHIVGGKTPTRVAITFDDRVSFVLTDKLQIKRIALTDVVKEVSQGSDLAKEEAFDADAALHILEMQNVIGAIVYSLGGYKTDEKKVAA